MSRENVEAVRRSFALFNERGIEAAVDAFGHFLAEDFVLDEDGLMPDRESHSGKQGFINRLRKLGELFRELRVEPEEFIELDQFLVVVVSISGRGRGSDAPVATSYTQLWELRDGKAVSLRDFPTKAEALEAAGLRESGG